MGSASHVIKHKSAAGSAAQFCHPCQHDPGIIVTIRTDINLSAPYTCRNLDRSDLNLTTTAVTNTSVPRTTEDFISYYLGQRIFPCEKSNSGTVLKSHE
jgi:hypothetical protein